MIVSGTLATRRSLQVQAQLAWLVERSAAPVIGVCGTGSKSVTASLIAEMLRGAGYRVTFGMHNALAGADFLGPHERVVVEITSAVSSSPPDGLAFLVITGLATDELEPGETTEQAIRAIRNAVAGTFEGVVVNADDARALALARGSTAPVHRAAADDAGADARVRDGEVIVRDPVLGIDRRVCRVADTSLVTPALTNYLLLAVTAAAMAGARIEDMRRAALQFTPEPDQFELVATRRRVRWVCDASATTPGRAAGSLMSGSGALHVIAGGRYGGQPVADWAYAANAHATHVLLFGSASNLLANALLTAPGHATIVRCADLEDAMAVAEKLAEPGDTVLFSPGCEPDALTYPTPADLFRERATLRRRVRREAA